MALDVSGNWQTGDDLRIITALSLPFGSFTLDCVQNCCAQLEAMSPEAVLEVRTLLDQYEAAKTAESSQNLADSEGKTLIKADVLEWQVDDSSVPSGTQKEMARTVSELKNYFAFCSCLGGFTGNNAYGTPLIRS